MIEDLKNTIQPVFLLMWIGLFVTLGTYLWMLSNMVYDSDLAALTEFARRLLDGQKMSEMYYDPNPPLSILIYVPVIWIQQLTGLVIYHAHFIYTLILGGVSFGLTARLLRFLKPPQSIYHLFLALFLITQIIVPWQDFGDRDHVVFLGLIPFLLVQIAIWKNIKIETFVLFASLLFGTILILLKPHYGLLPSVFLALRFFKSDGFKVLKSPDFLALAIGVIVYGIVLIIFFYDFISVIFPDSVSLYTSQRNAFIWMDVALFGPVLMVMALVFYTISNLSSHEKQIFNFLAIVTALLFVPFIVQGKGIDYHRIPYMSAFFMASAWALYCLINSKSSSKLALIITVLLLGKTVYLMRGVQPSALTHESFKELPLSEIMNEHCNHPCSFLMLSDNSENMHRLAAYHGAFHASRFTSMWYLPEIIQGNIDQDKIDRYVGMVSDDLKAFKPDIILILKDLPNYPDFKFLEFYQSHDKFAKEFAQYKKIDTVTLDRSLYFPKKLENFGAGKPSEFMIYKRQ